MKFKQFLEMEGVPEKDPSMVNALSDIKKILATMSEDEIDEFGEWLYNAMYDDGDEYDGDEDEFDLAEVEEMINSLNSDDLNYVYDMLISDVDVDDTGIGHTEGITEKKFFKKRKNILNREKKKDIVQRRKDRIQRRKDYKKYKGKIKRKQAKYGRRVKRNPNIVRHHR